jgi:hypothetical protein
LKQLDRLNAGPSQDNSLATLGRRHFASALSAFLFDRGDIAVAALRVGIDPRDIPMWGKTPNEIFSELYPRLTLTQRCDFLRNELHKLPGQRRLQDAFSHVAYDGEDHDVVSPPRKLNVNRGALDRSLSALSELISKAADSKKMIEFLADKLGVPMRPSPGVNYKRGADLLLSYLNLHGTVPDIDDSIAKGWQRSFALHTGDASSLMRSLPSPEVLQPKELSEIVDGFSQPGRTESLSGAEFVLLLRGLSQAQTRKNAQGVIEKLNPDIRIFLPTDAGDTSRLLESHLKFVAQTEPDRKLLENTLLKMLDRFLDNAEAHPLSDRQRCPEFLFDSIYQVLAHKGLNLDGYYERLERLAKTAAPSALWILRANLEPTLTHRALPATVRDSLFYKILEQYSPENVHILTGEAGSVFPGFDEVPAFPPGGFHHISEAVLSWIEDKVSSNKINESELSHFIESNFSAERNSELDARLANLIPKVKDRQHLVDLLGRRMTAVPFSSFRAFKGFEQAIQNLALLESQDLAARLYLNKAFLDQHPWAAYGYGPETIQKIKAFASSPDFSERQAELLINLLLSQDNLELNRVWISLLIGSTPDQGFHTMMRFLQYWQSLRDEQRNDFLSARVNDVLNEKRLQLARDVYNVPYQSILAQIAKLRAKGEEIPSNLVAAKARMDQYRELFEKQGEARGDIETRKATDQINLAILKDDAPTLKPDIEQRVLIAHELQGFQKASGAAIEDVERLLSHHEELLKKSGVLDRLVQFSNFADATGKSRLKVLVAEYADPSKTRAVEVIRPDLGGIKTTHLDYFGKFSELKEVLESKGIDKQTIDAFMSKWSPLWHFSEVPGEPGTYLSVTHDLERWIKHGEEPNLTCQRISARSSNLDALNWNAQFGINPNADGRPLARALLPQLKLAELRVGGKVLLRSLIEVTVKKVDGRPVLALLVHETFSHFIDASHMKNFNKALKEYARGLGISENDVHFTDSPGIEPLPEKYRIYRDSFRPKLSPSPSN